MVSNAAHLDGRQHDKQHDAAAWRQCCGRPTPWLMHSGHNVSSTQWRTTGYTSQDSRFYRQQCCTCYSSCNSSKLSIIAKTLVTKLLDKTVAEKNAQNTGRTHAWLWKMCMAQIRIGGFAVCASLAATQWQATLCSIPSDACCRTIISARNIAVLYWKACQR